MHKQLEQNSLSGLVKVLGLLLLLCLSISLFSCTKKTPGGIEVEIPGLGKTSLSPKETLRVNLETEPPTLDWNKSTDTTSSQVLVNVMEGLVEYDIYDPKMNLVPALASKWESSNDSKKWKFTLRQDVKWTDGVPFTAQHLLDSWKRLLDPATASDYAYFLFVIKNAQAFNQGKIKDFSEVGVKITSPNIIEVELEKSVSYFPHLTAHASAYPIRLDVIEKYGSTWTAPGHIQTLGAFTLKNWQHDKMLLLERNESYYGIKPTIKYVVGYIIHEVGTAIDMFDAGNLDGQDRIPSGEVKILSKRPQYHVMPSLLIQYYGFNVTRPPMDNLLVRQAISYAIDRKQVTNVLNGGQVPLTSWIPAGVFGYDAKIGINFDPVKAKALLKQAGYSEANPLPKIEIEFNTNEDLQRVAENIQAQLKTNLGINIELKNQEWKSFLNELKTKPPQIFRFGWMGDYPDPDNFMSLMTSYSDNNHTKWKNKDFDKLVENAAGEGNPAKRKAFYDEAQRLLVEKDVCVMPLYIGVLQNMIADRVSKYPQNLLQRKLYKGVVLK